jgi:hypothetical protein
MATTSHGGDGIPNNVLFHAGAPTVDLTYVGRAVVGSLLIDTINGKSYICTATNGTSKVTWVAVGTQTPRGSLQDQVLNHLPLMITGLFFIFAFAKLFVISHGNIQTARAMLSAAGAVEVLFGTFMGLLWFVGIVLFFAMLAVNFSARWKGFRTYTLYGAGLSLLLVLVTAPVITVALAFGFVAVFVVVDLLTESIGPSRPRTRPAIDGFIARWRPMLVSLLLFPLLLALTVDLPWFPSEDIALQNGDHVVGYVVGREENSLVVLVAEGRLIRRIGLSEMTSRQICDPVIATWFQNSIWSRPIIQLEGDDGYPDCPD